MPQDSKRYCKIKRQRIRIEYESSADANRDPRAHTIEHN